jgi:hypothetical protein
MRFGQDLLQIQLAPEQNKLGRNFLRLGFEPKNISGV